MEKDVKQTTFGSSASGKPSNTITSTSILEIQVLNNTKDLRIILSTSNRKTTKEPA
jgi:hypothetical protein